MLRSHISVISQDAVLLAGTIRYNLDPFQQYDDAWLAQCLRMVGLGEQCSQGKEGDMAVKVSSDTQVAGSPVNVVTASVLHLDSKVSENGANISHGQRVLHLDSKVSENGANISHGQRSLISIARALVCKSKIVILDEATASIDGRADHQLQAMLGDVMGNATVLTVAHRLDTVIGSCDRILVMERGAVAEFDSAPELYARAGLFRALCDAANVTAVI